MLVDDFWRAWDREGPESVGGLQCNRPWYPGSAARIRDGKHCFAVVLFPIQPGSFDVGAGSSPTLLD